jgi:hypothetical protein
MDQSARILQLESAIRNHRDQRGDDRCWMDDEELYAVLGDKTQPEFKLPPRAVFLQNCARFFECRQRSQDKETAVREYKEGK